ncbi:MAG: AMP-binding protein [Cryobacterium sp.]|nr:AMP-binding protein [Cryobacterium sp.]
MPRPLRVLPTRDAIEVRDALASALEGDGPALLPVDPSAAALPGAPADVNDDVALVVATSGSTGAPKLVALGAAALRASSAAAHAALGGPGQWLLALPSHYIAGLNVLARSLDAAIDPIALPEGPFDPVAFGDAAVRLEHPRRYTSLVPVQLARLLDEPAVHDALRRFDAILVGGQATPSELLDRSRRLGLTVVRTYGSSETAGGCVYDGSPLDDVRVRIVDGEVWLSGPTLANGYLSGADTDSAFVTEAGVRWYRTGDLGTVTDGILSIVGRIDDQIVSGGTNVSLGAVESVVRRMPRLADAVVVAAPSERWGSVPVLVTTADVELALVRTAVKEALGPAAAPARIVRVERIPLLPSGKPDRQALTRLAAQ